MLSRPQGVQERQGGSLSRFRAALFRFCIYVRTCGIMREEAELSRSTSLAPRMALLQQARATVFSGGAFGGAALAAWLLATQVDVTRLSLDIACVSFVAGEARSWCILSHRHVRLRVGFYAVPRPAQP